MVFKFVVFSTCLFHCLINYDLCFFTCDNFFVFGCYSSKKKRCIPRKIRRRRLILVGAGQTWICGCALSNYCIRDRNDGSFGVCVSFWWKSHWEYNWLYQKRFSASWIFVLISSFFLVLNVFLLSMYTIRFVNFFIILSDVLV